MDSPVASVTSLMDGLTQQRIVEVQGLTIMKIAEDYVQLYIPLFANVYLRSRISKQMDIQNGIEQSFSYLGPT